MGKLHLGNFSSLFQTLAGFAQRSRAPFWLIWTSIFLLLSLFLLSLVKILAYLRLPSSPVPPGFRLSWWYVTVLGWTALVLVFLSIAGVVDSLLRKSKKWRNRKAMKTTPTDKQLYTLIIWKKRYACPCATIKLLDTTRICFAYKFNANNGRSNISTLTIPITKSLYDCCVIVLLVLESFLVMASSAPPGKEKNKGKAPLVKVLIFGYNVNNSTNLTNATPIPTLKPPSGGSSSNNKNRKTWMYPRGVS